MTIAKKLDLAGTVEVSDMGWQFELRDANIAAYLTRPESRESDTPPRLNSEDLMRFFGALERPKNTLFSSDPRWVQEISAVARDSGRKYQRRRNLQGGPSADRGNIFLDPQEIQRSLTPLRSIFKSYDLYAVPVGSRRSAIMDSFMRYAAYTSEHHALMLLPGRGSRAESHTLDVFDPTPPFREVARQPENWPGVLFWLRTGESAFAPLREAESLFHRLAAKFGEGIECLASVLNSYNDNVSLARNRILHLSDLHFGHRDALEKEAYLETCLSGIKDGFEHVVITGDLFDSPREADYRSFYRFWTTLRNMTSRDPILIPGNHDQRTFGNNLGRIGQDFKYLANLKWAPGVTVDDRRQCVFLCFNSSEGGNFARGKISDAQLRAVGTEFEIERVRNPEIDHYSKIALIHHHPFPYADEELPVQRGRRPWFVGNERYVQLEDSEAFVKWCAARNVPLILHGHKHLPRHRSEVISPERLPEREVTAVGCGTSLGIGGKPLSYNIISWAPEVERWSASFFSDPGDGSGFHPDLISLYRSNAYLSR